MSIRFFSSDLDGTLLGKADATLAFARSWELIPPERRPLLCYNTGRLLADTQELIRSSELPSPDYLICGVGTMIYDVGKQSVVKAFSDVMDEGWDRKKIEALVSEHTRAELQPARFQHKFKSSWYLTDAKQEEIDEINDLLDEADLDVNVVYSSSRDLDVLPKFANKGNALAWLLKSLGISAKEALVAGDTGNDSAMFFIPGIKGVVVENAQPELLEAVMRLSVFKASAICADGVLEGLLHFGVIGEIAVIEPGHELRRGLEPEIKHLFDTIRTEGELSAEDLSFLELAYRQALEALRKNVTPLGFSACSLADNETRGTDANYRSVWARDGSIALIGALSVDDAELRTCCKNTLTTLLDHMSPPGQIPSNVRIEDEEPDYSGVGGICSIDSGMWAIIAFYEYIRETNDLDFLRERMGNLQKAVDWLSAHDSNNDALLEIPEAGDWTDLFGRSYNVLYDEVLWYRTNVSFGRLQEMLGQYRQAGDYLRWAQTIKRAILERFWPTIQAEEEAGPNHFADKQFTMGDTSYLLAQVTPFDFNWRCDVYANILAFLCNVLDADRARIAFRFLWGVGANEPYPVKNLYPVVTAGDPDWRSYYTVNLLNLPHHYHNGGIWPFIGAQWVRFIHRLGLRKVAFDELLKLAKLNESGISHAWEFNEWAHGETGRPMGKAFQAWSASEFLLACRELKINELVR